MYQLVPKDMFHPIKSKVIIRNWRLILWSKISLDIKFIKFKGFQIFAYFFLCLQWLLNILQFCDFSLNKSSKTYLRPMLLEPISPINLRNVQRRQHKVNGAKDDVLFNQHVCWNFTACLRIQLLSLEPCIGTYVPNAVAI